ncbi:MULTISPECIES: hypothetical protein [unclassified Mesorhizobium]|uniref:hypothetical protein n=1 Tax=unclassified Mesorhizobium TaxID=325217 RepID=UPI00333A4678
MKTNIESLVSGPKIRTRAVELVLWLDGAETAEDYFQTRIDRSVFGSRIAARTHFVGPRPSIIYKATREV